jgi:hypothetical protein
VVAYVRSMPRPDLKNGLAPAWASGFLRKAAQTRLEALVGGDWSALGPPPFHSEWIEIALERLRASTSWDSSNSVIRGVLIPSVPQLTSEHLEAIVDAAKGNGEVLGAFAFGEILAETRKYLGTSSIAKLSARTAVLDREIGVFDEQLCSRLDHLNHPDPSIVSTSPLLMAFDLIAWTYGTEPRALRDAFGFHAVSLLKECVRH